MSATTHLTVDKDIPFSKFIYGQLQFLHDYSFEALVKLSNQYERRYLAWEEVRKGRNPFFENGTGFEGYFVGVCSSPEEALQRILVVSQEMLTNLTKLHRYEPRFRSRLFRTLTGELNDAHAVAEWSSEFGAVLARLRCNVLQNRQTDAFQSETYRIVSWLPAIQYTVKDNTIKEHYEIVRTSPHGAQIVITTSMLKPSEQEAWLIAQSIGKFGHPLVRELA